MGMLLKDSFQKIISDKKNISVIKPNYISSLPEELGESQRHTQEAFSNKWAQTEHHSHDFDVDLKRQKNWYLELYGFKSEDEFSQYLKSCSLVLDAGAGKCGKAAWFAQLSPQTTVIAADISTSLERAADFYKNIDNLVFVRCDIASLPFFKNDIFDYVSCDQVIHHTADPYKTFKELVRLIAPQKETAVYVYRKKALPRELIDDYFREYSKKLTQDELMVLSKQITQLGKILTEDKKEYAFPAIPALQIEGGPMTIQRFIYWNFLKCYWNDEMGEHNSTMTNFDWYSPSLAFRYSEKEFRTWIKEQNLTEIYFHKELACFSGRFRKN